MQTVCTITCQEKQQQVDIEFIFCLARMKALRFQREQSNRSFILPIFVFFDGLFYLSLTVTFAIIHHDTMQIKSKEINNANQVLSKKQQFP